MTPKMKVAINGFGRIGRMVMRAFLERGDSLSFDIVAINDLSPIDANAHMLEYDSVHGRLKADIQIHGDMLVIAKDGRTHNIRVVKESDPKNLPWNDIDIVLECSGRFTNGNDAKAHLEAGAKRVFISSPATNVDTTIVYGVNHTDLKPSHHIFSNASCTTNCLAPVAKILHETFGLEHGYMTTIHSYTADQRLVDGFHNDMYRARAAAMSLIPTTTGAAKAVGLVLPDLKGRLDGTAIRVPTPNVSLIDFKLTTKKPVTVDAINAAMIDAAKGPLEGILAINNKPLVSVDFNGDPHSSIFDVNQTQVLGTHFARVLSWYDNEWGFSNRMIDVLEYSTGA
ncbi:MAG: type I glyceraldehyde-3-phosphate dehydrogenase [Alphaproteobacteria bacterium]|nr:type I glyceraldehyde-3-phosphate dehydrogenase [Alphaproteobacteria bacterium]